MGAPGVDPPVSQEDRSFSTDHDRQGCERESSSLIKRPVYIHIVPHLHFLASKNRDLDSLLLSWNLNNTLILFVFITLDLIWQYVIMDFRLLGRWVYGQKDISFLSCILLKGSLTMMLSVWWKFSFALCVDLERAMENLDKLDTLSENSDSDYIIMSNVSREPPVLDPEDSPSLFNLLMELIWTFLCALCR